MSLFIAFIAGALLALLLTRGTLFKPASKPEEIVPDNEAALPALPAPATEMPPSPVAQLKAMTEELNAIGEASSHPRDVSEHERFRAAVAVLEPTSVPLTVLTDYAAGANWMLSAVAFAALAARPDRDEVSALLLSKFRHLRPWPMLFALQYIEKLRERPPIGALLLHCPEWWVDNPIAPGLLAEHFARREAMGDAPGFGDSLAQMQPAAMDTTETLLRVIEHPASQVLLDQIAAWRRSSLDRPFLQSFGRFLEAGAEEQLLIEHDAIADQLAVAQACVLHSPARSMLIIGDSRMGKTSFARLLAKRMNAQGWAVLEAGGANLMAGQTYIGELEERLQRMSTELAVEKRVLWYVPDLVQLALSGTHKGQPASILDQIFPAVAAGRIVLIGEITSSQLTALLQTKPVLRSALELIRLKTLNEEQIQSLCRDFIARLAETFGVTVAPDVLDTATHMARHYLGTTQMPGAVLDLLKLAAQRVAANEGSKMQRDDLLATLSQLTGMPQLVLDDRERVDLTVLRKFFTSRVIGQDEAVNVVVDRIAMLKAGLTDPGRPVAVFMFAGSTGTGKTELAKTLAEFLFGSAERLIRLDMSEFQSHEATRKIVGDPGDREDAQALTHRVRKQPFCVVLLDEFEKAHPNVWDLFLQVFDDGRLSDAGGHTVDFRHSIIILTSNLGATAHQGSGLGFASQASAFSQEQVLRAVNQSFRPEFVNRLDNVIVFRPLTRDLMRGILAKELARVLERRGLRHREWAVEWESSALDFLLNKGFSPAMGARPLKRAIDQHLLAPLAATMVEHRFPEGDQFLFVRSDGNSIQVEFVDPDAKAKPKPADRDSGFASTGPTLAGMMLQANGTSEERRALESELRNIENRLADSSWRSLEADLVTQMQRQDFWNRSDRQRVLSRYALMDRVKAAKETALGLDQRLSRTAGKAGRYSNELVARLASQLYVLDQGIQDALGDAPIEVILAIQPVLDSSPDTALSVSWRERLLEMYRAWAAQRRMQLVEIEGVSASQTLFMISGFGAARVLAAEAGLHVLEHEDTAEDSNRYVARVRVAPTPGSLPSSPKQKHATLLAELDKSSAVTTVIRRYRLGPSPLIRDVRGGWRTGRADLVLAGNFDLLGAVLPITT